MANEEEKMSITHLPHIEKLKGVEDFNNWKFAIQSYLELEDLWKNVEVSNTEANPRESAKSWRKLIYQKSIGVRQ